jgi:integrase
MPPPSDESTPDLLAAFRLHGLASGHSPRTRTAREATILRLSEGSDLLTVTREDLIEWLASLDIAKSSRATYRAHLRVWFGWLAETGRREDNPASSLPAVRAPRGVPRPISPADVARILAACSDPRARSTAAYVLLAAYEGMRVHEIAKVQGEDFAGGEVRITGKGSLRHHFGTQVLRASGGDLRTTQRALRPAASSPRPDPAPEWLVAPASPCAKRPACRPGAEAARDKWCLRTAYQANHRSRASARPAFPRETGRAGSGLTPPSPVARCRCPREGVLHARVACLIGHPGRSVTLGRRRWRRRGRG